MPLRVAVVDIKWRDGKRLTKRVDNVRARAKSDDAGRSGGEGQGLDYAGDGRGEGPRS